jgi:hypothetical protein
MTNSNTEEPDFWNTAPQKLDRLDNPQMPESEHRRRAVLAMSLWQEGDCRCVMVQHERPDVVVVELLTRAGHVIHSEQCASTETALVLSRFLRETYLAGLV